MMAREEAIEELERLLRHWDDLENGKRCFWGYDNEAVALALSALRPITREQVEKMRGKFFQAGIDDVAQDTWRCSRCLVQEFGNIQGINFCPSCGAPITDEAVDMVMERLEAMYEET